MKKFKPMKAPQPSDHWGSCGKWNIIADDDKILRTYLHDDLEWYDGGCWSRGRSKGDKVLYSTSADFDSESIAWERRALYYIKHGMIHLIHAEKNNDSNQSQVMEF